MELFSTPNTPKSRVEGGWWQQGSLSLRVQEDVLGWVLERKRETEMLLQA